MMFFLISLTVGYYRICTYDKTRVLNLLLKYNINYFGLKTFSGGDGDGIVFSVLTFSLRRVRRMLSENGVSAELTLCGFPAFIKRYRKRYGIFIGVVIWVALCFMSEKFFWQIDVKGNERISDGEILSYVKAHGVYEGARCDNLNTLLISNECLIEHDTLSYMSINIIGNHAEVVVRENVKKPSEAINTSEASNIIAKRSGRVVSLSVESGSALVSTGDVVFAGQTLITGVYTLWGERYALVPAKGSVFAETVREFSVSVPYTVQEKYVKEVFEGEKEIIFFTKPIKFSKGSRNIPHSCDIIENRERIMLFGRIALPLWIDRKEYVLYGDRTVTLFQEDAVKKAKDAIMSELSGFTLIDMSKDVIIGSEGVTVKVLARIEEDITQAVPVAPEEIPKEPSQK